MDVDDPTDETRQARIEELQDLVADRDRLAALLVDAEQRLAEVPELTQRIAALESELALTRHSVEVARLEAQQLDQMLMYGRRMLRYVRPAIKPLRDARRRLRG